MKKQLMNNKKDFKNFIIFKILPLIITMASLVAAFFMFTLRNKSSITTRNKEYLKESTTSLQQRLNVKFESSLHNISSIAYLFGESISSVEESKSLIKDIEKQTEFNYVRFITKEGDDITSEGEAPNVNLSDRDYFIDGMKGNKGITLVEKSRVNGQRQIGFYAPVYSSSNIEGILIGFYTDSSLSSDLYNTFYGKQSSVFIIDSNKKIVTSSMNKESSSILEGSEDKYSFNSILNSYYFNDKNKDIFESSISNKGEGLFQINTKKGKTYGYITRLSFECIDWYIVQTYPYEATQILFSIATDSGLSLEVAILVITAFYVTYIVVMQVLKNKRIAQENRIATYVTSAARDIFKTMFFVDLEQDRCEDLSINKHTRQKIGTLNELKEYVISEVINEKQISDVMQFFHPSNLKNYDPSKLTNMVIEVINRTSKEENYLSMTFVPTEVEGSIVKCGLLVFNDVTDQKKKELQANIELEDAYNKSQSASKAKTSFLFNMSHDIRTPMNAILGFADLIEKHLDEKDKCKMYLQKLKSSSSFLLSLINNILDMARIESGKTELHEEVKNMKELHEEVVSILNQRKKIVQRESRKRREIGLTASQLGLEPVYLIIDEFASVLASFGTSTEGRKKRKLCESLLLQILMQSRACGIIVLYASQSPSTEVLNQQMRSQFSIYVLLGSATSDVQRMALGQVATAGNVDRFAGYYVEETADFTTPQEFEVPDFYTHKLNELDTFKCLYNRKENEKCFH